MPSFYNEDYIREIGALYRPIKGDIEKRLAEFKKMYLSGSEEDIFAELAFCLFTPQSKARSCWSAVCSLRRDGKLLSGSGPDIAAGLNGVRFHNAKAGYLKLAQNRFADGGKPAVRDTLEKFKSPFEIREWLIGNIKGMGYKEASHFLRNIGMGEDLAILDRHILKNLVRLGMINEIPSHLSRKKYLEIEEKIRQFSRHSKIPMGHLDLLLWYREAGELFK